MAIRNIVKEGDPILNKVCRPVTTFDDRLATLLDDMHETMIAADGVGLAGPQVGMLRRLFVVWDTTDAPEEIPEDYEYKFIDFVNPEILAVSEEEETAYEGCLSFPGHNGAVTRPAAVKVRAQDRHGEWFELEAEDLLGRCIQHENDHLDGITIMQSSEYFYEDTEEGKKAAREAKGNKSCAFCSWARRILPQSASKPCMPPGMTSARCTPGGTSRLAASRCLPHPRLRKWPLPTARRCSSPAPCGTAARTRTSAHWPRN